MKYITHKLAFEIEKKRIVLDFLFPKVSWYMYHTPIIFQREQRERERERERERDRETDRGGGGLVSLHPVAMSLIITNKQFIITLC